MDVISWASACRSPLSSSSPSPCCWWSAAVPQGRSGAGADHLQERRRWCSRRRRGAAGAAQGRVHGHLGEDHRDPPAPATYCRSARTTSAPTSTSASSSGWQQDGRGRSRGWPAIGTETSDAAAIQDFFAAKFSEALKTVGKQLDFVDLYTKREEFRDRIIQVIGTDLNGYHLDDAAIDFLEQTPMTQLDNQGRPRCQGIRKITELTTIEHVRTNEFQRTEQEITRQNVDARETILELERGGPRPRSTSSGARSRPSAPARRPRPRRCRRRNRLGSRGAAHVRAEEQLRHPAPRTRGRQSPSRRRTVSGSSPSRTSASRRTGCWMVIARERETGLTRIAADKEVEAERREIAEVIRERVAVDRTVAEQEESIKKLRAVEEAERGRQTVIIAAEAQAQEKLVKDIKAAEAAETAAEHCAAEQLTLAEARLKSADLDARAKLRLAEGVQAESAAAGLADVQVRDKAAEVTEKAGRAEAVATEARLRAEAEGTEARLRAGAEGSRAKALAEATGIGEKLKAEAEGLGQKAVAMAALDDASRGHEEYRLRIQAEKEIRLAGL